MIKEFKLPELGEDTATGQVTKVLVSVGDDIEMEQGVIELETGKATFEVPCDAAGKVKEIKVKDGDEVKVGQTILTLESDGEGEEKAEEEPKEEESAEEPEEKEEPAEEAESPEEEERETESKSEKKPARKPEPAAEKSEEEPAASAKVPAAPSVRKFAREIGVDIADVEGTGPHDRISVEDVKAHAKRILESAGKGEASGGAPALPDFEKWGTVRREPMNNVRRMTARHMATSWRAIPHVTQFDSADITQLESVRKKYGAPVEKAGGKLTVTAIAIKVASMALGVFARFNASIDPAREEIIYKEYCHIGCAVDTERGLLVPTIRDADKKSITEIAVELVELSNKARDNKMKPDDLAGATFTVTNLGSIGGSHFSPIISHPQVAILGLGRAAMRPVWREDRFEPGLVLPLSLSYDHRAIDGADGARFLRWIAQALESPLFAWL